jgi:hypothetical protein
MAECGEIGAVRHYFGTALWAVGSLVALLSGLCTGLVVVGGSVVLADPLWIFAAAHSGEAARYAQSVLLAGGLPFLVGCGLILCGVAVLRQPPRGKPERGEGVPKPPPSPRPPG